MQVALSLWFEEKLEQKVNELWRSVESAGVSSMMFDGRFRPHVTIGVFDIQKFDACKRELQELTAEISAFPIRFESVGLFPGMEGVVFLAPIVTDELIAIHRQISQVAAAHGVASVPYYESGVWVPHCTVACKISQDEVFTTTRTCLEAGVLPMEGRVNALGIIQTPEELELHRLPLSDAAVTSGSEVDLNARIPVGSVWKHRLGGGEYRVEGMHEGADGFEGGSALDARVAYTQLSDGKIRKAGSRYSRSASEFLRRFERVSDPSDS